MAILATCTFAWKLISQLGVHNESYCMSTRASSSIRVIANKWIMASAISMVAIFGYAQTKIKSPINSIRRLTVIKNLVILTTIRDNAINGNFKLHRRNCRPHHIIGSACTPLSPNRQKQDVIFMEIWSRIPKAAYGIYHKISIVDLHNDIKTDGICGHIAHEIWSWCGTIQSVPPT